MSNYPVTITTHGGEIAVTVHTATQLDSHVRRLIAEGYEVTMTTADGIARTFTRIAEGV